MTDGVAVPDVPPPSGWSTGSAITVLVLSGLVSIAATLVDFLFMLFIGGVDTPNGRTDITPTRWSMGSLVLIATVVWWIGVARTVRAVGRRRSAWGPVLGFGGATMVVHLVVWGIGNS